MFCAFFFWLMSTEVPLLAEPDREIVIEAFSRLDGRPSSEGGFAEMALGVGRGFLGSVYQAHTLDGHGRERLVIKLDGFDCLTLVENCLAIARAYGRGANPDFFVEQLRLIRYRNGVLDRYPSRLHYAGEWARDNAAKGFLRDVTRQLGGVPYEKTINFMSNHRSAYPSLADDAFFQAILATETLLNQKQSYYIPKKDLPRAEAGISNGDVLLITTSIEGLDVIHVGLAFKKSNGSLHMLHASQKSGRVEITPEPFYAYLMAHSNQSGVMLLRPLPPQQVQP